jgi:hypothetical protein
MVVLIMLLASTSVISFIMAIVDRVSLSVPKECVDCKNP